MLEQLNNFLRPSEFHLFREEINLRNDRAMNVLTISGLPFAALNILAQRFIADNRADHASYALLVYFVALFIVYRTLLRRKCSHMTLMIYLIEIPPMVLTMLMGSVLDPTHQAISYLLCLSAMPLFILDVPWRVISIMTAWTAAFLGMCYLFKDPATWRPDTVHVLEFYMMSMTMTSVVLSSRIDGLRMYFRVLDHYERDELTGLSSGESFFSRCQAINENMDDFPKVPYIAHVNFMEMKGFNESYGWEDGDRLLQAIGQSIDKHFPERLTAHIGNDHFAVMAYKDELEEGLHQVYEDIVHWLEEFGRELGDAYQLSPVITEGRLKVGICACRKDESCVLTYDRAKRAGASILLLSDHWIREYDDVLREETILDRHIFERIDMAIEKDWLEVYYQPIMRSVTGELSNEEALARWNDPEYGMISPGVFIPVLEEKRLTWKLDLAILRAVLRDMEKREKAGLPILPISINFSRYDFQGRDLVGMVSEIVEASPYGPEKIIIEITESAYVDDPQFINENLNFIIKLHKASAA